MANFDPLAADGFCGLGRRKEASFIVLPLQLGLVGFSTVRV